MVLKPLTAYPDDLLIAKIDMYGFEKEAFPLTYPYLKNRKQSVRIYNAFLRTNFRYAARISFESLTF